MKMYDDLQAEHQRLLGALEERGETEAFLDEVKSYQSSP